MTGFDLFRRSWKLTIGGPDADNPQAKGLDVSQLPIEFKIVKSLKPTPNSAEIVVYNLNEDHRAQFLKRNRPPGSGSKIAGIQVSLEAGYVGNVATILQCDLRQAVATRESVDWKLTLAGEDGGRAWREGRVNASFKKGTTIYSIAKQCATALGVGLGNIKTATSTASIAASGATIPHSMTISGSAAEGLDRVMKSAGLTWSIQNGALQILPIGGSLKKSALHITPSSGLIDSPAVAIDASVSLGTPGKAAGKKTSAHPPKAKTPGIVRIKTLLIPGMVPGQIIQLDSANFHGSYVLTECQYVGQSWGTDWCITSVARVLSTSA